MTTQRFKVSGFITLDMSYETTIPVPESHLGRELEWLKEQGMLPEISAADGGSHIIMMTTDPKTQTTWKYGERRFTECVAEVVPCSTQN